MTTASGGSIIWKLDIDDKLFNSKLRQAKTNAGILGDDLDGSSKKGSGGLLKMAGVMGVVAGAAQALVTKGIDAISNSVSGAVSRLDTLNNFPKVMGNLGIGASDAQSQIKRMSDSLTGLPTTLDTAALAVQRLTSSNGDITKSTDIFLALNNAVLAGGAPMEMQTQATEQFAQAFAKGKPDMMEWRSMLSAMPAQLNQVATAMGLPSADALGEKLRTGEISMQQFSDKLIELNSNGPGGLPGFAEQAKNATGGIGTSMEVLKTSITRGLTGILDSIGTTNITSVIGGIGKSFEGMLKSFGEGAGPGLAIFFQELTKAIQVLSPYLSQIANIFGQVLGSILSALAPLLPPLAEIIGVIALAFAQLVQAIAPVIVQIINAFIPYLPQLQSMFNRVLQALMPLVPVIVDMFLAFLPLVPVLIDLAMELLPILIKGLELLVPVIAIAAKFFVMYLKNNIEITVSAIKAIIGVISWLKDETKASVDRMIQSWNMFKQRVTEFVNIGRDIINGIVNGIRNGANQVVETVKNIAKGAIDAVKNFLGIRSPSKVFAGIGENMMEGLAVGVQSMTNSTKRAVEGAISTATGVTTDFGSLAPSNMLDDFSGSEIKPVTVAVNMNNSGIVARSRSDWRDIMKDGIEAVNEELRAKGIAELGGGAVVGGGSTL